MKIKKQKDYIIFTNSSNQEYHLSHENFNRMGKDKSIKFVEAELKKKKNASYADITIDFDRARNLGFCEYGIKEFCEQLNLNIKKEYTIKHLLNVLTVDVLMEYPFECYKLFGDAAIAKFGGPITLLNEYPTAKTRNFILESNVLTDKQKHILALLFAKSVLPNYENENPDNKAPRTAIEVKAEWIEHPEGGNFGEIPQKYKNIILHS